MKWNFKSFTINRNKLDKYIKILKDLKDILINLGNLIYKMNYGIVTKVLIKK